MSQADPIAEARDLTLATVVHRRLREDILSGRLPPGQKLKLRDLAESYGAGASPMREALSKLAAEGLAERLEHRGFRVAAAAPGQLDGLIRSRVLAECAALRESIRHGDAAWEEALVLAEHRLKRAARSLDPHRFVANPEWEACHLRFHQALLAACGAPPLLAFCDRLREEAQRYRALSNTLAYPGRDVAAEHAAIARATLDRDAEKAAALLTQHYERTGAFIGADLGSEAG
ncbi:GntR family transcriptional regulator [Roseomonas marmotae]|uniref:GntR family transcriptional regulator n=1 Tax=Roseomonas marmotae TaxID=2768161 RepID=A0ABS3KA31_9PROT|nr:GntR family transcriptional regulator [Roseomonas marmotae]MBO1073503.1 GntR family transcriptional regulator [Roseomonas marmotae]QTI80308.1 GntR family transcriptional regulator [Roseomonas marmotae]